MCCNSDDPHPHADHTSSASAPTADLVERFGAHPERIVVTPLAQDPAYAPVTEVARLASVRRRYGLPEQFILFVGTIEPRKVRARFIDQAPLMPQRPLAMRQKGTTRKAGEHCRRCGYPETVPASAPHCLPSKLNAQWMCPAEGHAAY